MDLFLQLGPTMERDRSGDRVYENTMEVVRTVMSMVNDIHTVKSDQYVNLVKVSLCKFMIWRRHIINRSQTFVNAIVIKKQRHCNIFDAVMFHN